MLKEKQFAIFVARLVCGVFAVLPLQAQLPTSAVVTPASALTNEKGMALANAPAKVSIPAPSTGNLTVICRTGTDKAGLRLEAVWNDGSRMAYPLRVKNGPHNSQDSALILAGNKDYYIRPNLGFYANGQRRGQMLRSWKQFEAASEHALKIEFRKVGNRTQVWVDERLFQNEQDKTLKSLELTMPKGAAVQIPSGKSQRMDSADYLVLNLTPFARPAAWPAIMKNMGWENALAKGKMSLSAGMNKLDGVPVYVTAQDKNIDALGMGFLWCPSDDGFGFYWRRSTLDMLPEACIVTVPLDTYSEAYVLCAADPAPKKAEEKDPDRIPEFNLRMTRHSWGRGDAFSDSPVRPADGKKVGTLTLPNGKQTDLMLVRVPLKSGMIQDLMREEESQYGFGPHILTKDYLDFEITDVLLGVDEADRFPTTDLQAVRRRSYAPPTRRSSVHVFGLTLKKSPVELILYPANAAKINAFFANEVVGYDALLKPRKSGNFLLRTRIADVDGKICFDDTKELKLEAGKDQSVKLTAPSSLLLGWYQMSVSLSEKGADTKQAPLLDARASFAITPKDSTRKQQFDSPFGSWWFNWAPHGACADTGRIGPLLKRMGFRHTMSPDPSMKKDSVFTWCIPWKQPGAASVESWVNGLDTQIQEHLKKYPYADTVMIYHESDCYGGRFPSELWGIEAKPLNEKSEKNWQFRMKHVLPGLKMIREKYPQLKIQIGNTGDSCVMVYEMFRHGLTDDLVDRLGSEVLGQTIMPERPHLYGLHAAWFLRETARLFKSKAQVTATYEWINRMHTKLGLRQHAEWYVRDALVARSYGFPTIALGSIHDSGTAYFHSIWGNGGYCYRYPYLFPKPAYSAMAFHTSVLDSSRFLRMVPASKTSLNVMEFQRADKTYVYALWVVRGEMDVKAVFPQNAQVEAFDLYGRSLKMDGKEFRSAAKTAPVYLVSGQKLASLEAGATRFPGVEPPKNAVKTESMESLNGITLDPWSGYKRLHGEFPYYMPAQGAYRFTEETDPEKGKCIKITLHPEGKDPFPFVYEHVFLKFDAPKKAQGPFTHVGMWVKGNGSWAEIIPSVVASDGKSARLIKPEWFGDENINFDGWTFMKFKLPNDPKWRNGEVSLGSILFAMPRQVLRGSEFERNPNLSVCVKDVMFFLEK